MLEAMRSTLWALGGQKVIKILSKNDAKIGIEKSRFRGRPIANEILELVARRGVRGEVTPWGVNLFFGG